MTLKDLNGLKLDNKKIYTATKEYSQRCNYGKNNYKRETFTDIICFNFNNKFCIVVVNEFSVNPIVKEFINAETTNKYFKAVVKNSGLKFERKK